MWIGIIEQKIFTDSAYDFAISAVPEFYLAGSIIVITGQITNNSTGIPLPDFVYEVQFDFGIPPQPIVFSPDVSGFFTVTLPVDPALTHPATGQLTFTNTNFATVDAAFDLFTSPTANLDYSFSVPEDLKVYGEYTITGSAPSGTNLTLTSGGIFPTQNIIADAAGNWSYSFAVPNTVSPGSYDFIVNSSLGTLTETRTVDLIGFNPVFTSFNPDVVGIETNIFPNSNTVDPHTELNFELVIGGTVYELQEIIADNSGSFNFNPLTLPVSVAGATATIRFVRSNPPPSLIVEETITLPDFNSTITYDFPDDPIYTGEDYSIAVTITSGYSPTIKIFDPSSNLIASTSSEFNLAIDSPEGIYTFEISAPNHDPVTFTKNVLTGFLVELIDQNKLLFPGDSHFISILGKPGETVNFNVFGNNYTGILDVNGELLQEIIIPPGTFGSNVCLVSSSYYPNTKAVGLFVDNPADYTLSFPDPGLIFTNSSSSLFLSGLLLPSKEATITIPEFGVSQTIVGDDLGAFTFSLNLPWQPSGTYNLTVTSPGETTINYSGSHRPELQIIPDSIDVNPGDPSGSFQIRGDANEELIVSIEPMVAETTITTDSSGYYDLIYPAINSSIVEDISYLAKAKTVDLLYQVTASLEVNYDPIELTINITNPEINDLLFTNSTYNISGNKPDIEAFALSNIGNIDSLTINNKSGTTYDATLVTNENVGIISLIASTLYQPPLSKNFTVDYPLTLSVPTGLITFADSIAILASSDPSVWITLELYYQDNDDITYLIESYNQITDSAGDTTFNLTIANNFRANKLKFVAKVSGNYQLEEIRDYQNGLSQAVGLPLDDSEFIFTSGGFVVPNKQLSNLATTQQPLYLTTLVNPSRSSSFDTEIQKTGNYLAARLGNTSRNNTLGIRNPSLDYSFIDSNNGFTCFYSHFFDNDNLRVNFISSNFYLVFAFSRLRFYIEGTFIQTRVLPKNVLYDFCIVYLKNDPDNGGNTTVKLYIDGIEEVTHNLTYVYNFNYPNDKLIEIRGVGSTFIPGNIYFLDRPLTHSEVINSYFNNIRKKIRRYTIEDFAKSCIYSLLPGDNPGYYEENPELFGVIPTEPEPNLGTFFLENSLLISEDSEKRKYYQLNNATLQGGTTSLGNEHLMIFRRKSLNLSKQVFFDCRRSSSSFAAFELAFTGLDKITLTVNQSGTYRQAVFSNSVIQTFAILNIFYRINITTPIIYVNGVELISSFTTIADPGNLSNETNKIAIGSKLEGTDYCNCDFYGYLNLQGLGAFADFTLFFSSIAEKAAYYAWCAGFKEAMENVNPSFPLLSQYDGFYHL